MHVLDNPAWHALTGPHTTVAEQLGDAARYERDVSVFAALADADTPEAWGDLRDLIGPGRTTLLARRRAAVPPAWTVAFTSPCRQMRLTGELRHEEARNDGDIVPLGVDDVAEMLALVERTRPGPFATRTIELGSYVGVREDRVLIAMAGERMHPPGYTEISAVCTDSAHRGRGLASRLVARIVRGIQDRGETPFLHLTLENENAHRVYRALGFETRGFLDVLGVQAPP